MSSPQTSHQVCATAELLTDFSYTNFTAS